MKYEIVGDMLPAVICHLEAGEQMICESGAMSWMDDEIEMSTEGGGAGKVLGRMFSGEHLFKNRYTAKKPGSIAFASSFPGVILAVRVTPDKPIVVQKSSFLAHTNGIEMSVFFQKKMGAGFFGGEGFVMNKFEGNGVVFLEIDGSIVEYDIAAGDCKIMETGHLAMMDATCKVDIRKIKGAKNILLGGEGLFNTVVSGPGHIVIQTMPRDKMAEALIPYIPVSGS